MKLTFDQSKDEIARLAKYFAANRDAFLAPGYKETHCRQEFIAFVRHILEPRQRLASARSQAVRDLYHRQIAATDSQIDALIYELYGLTEDEINVVGDSSGAN